MKRIIGVLSGKGGVGKTTTCVNLGLALHKLGEDVIVVDGDLKNPNLGLHLGVFEYNVTLHDVIEREISLLEALHIHETGLRFIPAHISLQYLSTDPADMREIFAEMNSSVLVDFPPGLGKVSMAFLDACDEVLIVTRPQLPDLTDSLKAIEVAREMGVNIMGIVLNHVMSKGYEISKDEVEAISGARVLHEIPWDENVLKSLARKTPLVEMNPYSPAAVAFFELASEISGREYRRPSFLKLRNFFKR